MGCTSSIELTEKEIRQPIIKAMPIDKNKPFEKRPQNYFTNFEEDSKKYQGQANPHSRLQ